MPSQFCVAICIPSGGHPHWKFWDSIERMRFYSLKHGIDTDRKFKKSALVQHNRNLLIDEVLRLHKDATHILFVDDDMVYPEDTIQKLLRAGKDICICQGFHKFEPYTPLTTVLSPDGVLVPVHLNPESDGRILPVSSGGGGTMLIRKEVFEKVPFPWFQVQYEKFENVPEQLRPLVKETCIRDHILIGEDVWFFAQAQAAGYTVYCHFGLAIGHINPDYEVTYKDYEAFNERNKGNNQNEN